MRHRRKREPTFATLSFTTEYHFLGVDENGEPKSYHSVSSLDVENQLVNPSFESMSDVIDPSRIAYNPVYHSKGRVKGDGAPDELVIGPIGQSSLIQKYRLSSYTFDSPPSANGPSQATLTRFGNDVLTQAVEQFGEEVSIANALYELREAAQLLVRDWALRLLAGKIGESYLSWQFGWKPLLSDIQKLCGVAKSVRKRLKHLKETNGKVITTYFNGFGEDDDSIPLPIGWSDDVDVPPHLGGSARALFMSQTAYIPKRSRHFLVATVKTIRHLEGLDGALATALGVENALGLNNLPKVIWNATPFSWMVEWFINLSRPLAAFDTEPFKGTTRILSCNYSVKSKSEYDVVGYQLGIKRSRDPDCLVDRRTVASYTATSYSRINGFPPSAWVFAEDSFSANQLAILLALLAANHNR